MTLYQFNALNEEQKLEAVFASGESVGSRKDGVRHVILYQLPQFYVELSSSHAELSNNLVAEESQTFQFRSFTSLEPLEPYLEGIDI
jgi:hypothetical protein